MKFGKTLESSLLEVWRYYYLDYNLLKKLLKQRTLVNGEYTEQDEANFVFKLDSELEKIKSFRKLKREEIQRRLILSHQKYAQLSKEPVPDLAEFYLLQTELAALLETFHSLQSYSRLNFTGFHKIIKKHDRRTSYQIAPMFNEKLNMSGLDEKGVDKTVFAISDFYALVRRKISQLDNNSKEDEVEAEKEEITKKTLKYWFHPDNLVDLEYLIMRNLPAVRKKGSESVGHSRSLSAHSFQSVISPGQSSSLSNIHFTDQDRGSGASNELVSSIYLDNSEFEMYTSRLEKNYGATAIRLQWYGDIDSNKEIYIERKTRLSNLSSTTSTAGGIQTPFQTQFPDEVLEDKSHDSRFAVREQDVAAFLKGDFTPENVVAYYKSKNDEISEEKLKHLKNLSGEIQKIILQKKLKPIVRIVSTRSYFQLPKDNSLRVSLDSDIVAVREDKNTDYWRRLDYIGGAPANLPPEDFHVFKYAVMEVKVRLEKNEQLPYWLDDLVANFQIEESSKFSKPIHAVATLFETKVNLLPFWLPDMERDILKPQSMYNKEEQSRLIVQQPILVRPEMKYNPNLAVPTEIYEENSDANGGAAEHSRVGSTKRIILPKRIEPKIYLANERTFLTWMHFGMVLSTLAIGLINFGDGVGVTSGILFTCIALVFMTYAVYLYSWRTHKIKSKAKVSEAKDLLLSTFKKYESSNPPPEEYEYVSQATSVLLEKANRHLSLTSQIINSTKSETQQYVHNILNSVVDELSDITPVQRREHEEGFSIGIGNLISNIVAEASKLEGEKLVEEIHAVVHELVDVVGDSVEPKEVEKLEIEEKVVKKPDAPPPKVPRRPANAPPPATITRDYVEDEQVEEVEQVPQPVVSNPPPPAPKRKPVSNPPPAESETEVTSPPAITQQQSAPPPVTPRRPVKSTPPANVPVPVELQETYEQQHEPIVESTSPPPVAPRRPVKNPPPANVPIPAEIQQQQAQLVEEHVEHVEEPVAAPVQEKKADPVEKAAEKPEKAADKEKKEKKGFKSLFHINKSRPSKPGKKKSDNEASNTNVSDTFSTQGSISQSLNTLAADPPIEKAPEPSVTNAAPQLPPLEISTRPLSPISDDFSQKMVHTSPISAPETIEDEAEEAHTYKSESAKDGETKESESSSPPLYRRPTGAAAALANAMMRGVRNSTASDISDASTDRKSIVFEKQENNGVSRKSTYDSRKSVVSMEIPEEPKESKSGIPPPVVPKRPKPQKEQPPLPLSPARKSVIDVEDSALKSPASSIHSDTSLPQRPARPPPRVPVSSSPPPPEPQTEFTAEEEYRQEESEHKEPDGTEESEVPENNEPPPAANPVPPKPAKRIPGIYMAPGHGAISALASAMNARRPLSPGNENEGDEGEVAPRKPSIKPKPPTPRRPTQAETTIEEAEPVAETEEEEQKGDEVTWKPTPSQRPTQQMEYLKEPLHIKKNAHSTSGDDRAIEANSIEWMNHHLKEKDIEVQNLFSALADGLNLVYCLEAATGESVGKYNKRALLPVHKIDNIAVCLTFLQKRGINTSFLNPQDVMNEDRGKILTLFNYILKKYPLPE